MNDRRMRFACDWSLQLIVRTGFGGSVACESHAPVVHSACLAFFFLSLSSELWNHDDDNWVLLRPFSRFPWEGRYECSCIKTRRFRAFYSYNFRMQESLAHPAPQTDRRVCVLSPHRKATLLKCFERVSKLSDLKGLRFGRAGNNASKKKLRGN